MPRKAPQAAAKPGDSAAQTAGTTRKPRPGSRAWEENLANSPEYAKSMIRTLADRARQGKPEAAERVLAWLEKFPELRSTVRELDDLTAKVEDAWVRALTGQDALAERAARDEVAGMKAELVAPGAGVLERVLAGAVVVAYLAHQRAAAVAARSAAPGVAAVRDRRLTAAQKRLVAAVKALETVARKKAAGVRPGRKLKLFDPSPEAA